LADLLEGARRRNLSENSLAADERAHLEGVSRLGGGASLDPPANAY
jgi:hypothetical protein